MFMISVVVPAYNEENNLRTCLNSLVSQNTKKKFEVIVVDNNSTDNTNKVALSFKNQLKLKVIKELKQGRGAARRAGFAAARGEIIFSTDADTKLPQNWIDVLRKELADDQVVAVTSRCRVSDCSWLVNNLIFLLHPLLIYAYRLIFGHFWISGYNTAIRASTYFNTRGFDSSLSGMEDADLGFQLAKHGKIKYIEFPVEFSGRRYKDGVISGILSYFPSFINYFLGKKEVTLSDIR